MNLINDNINAETTTQSTSKHKASYITHKKMLFVTLAAAALTLSACGKKDDSTIEGSALELDSQTSNEQAAAEIAAASAPMNSNRENSPILPSEDMPENTGAISEDGAIVSEDMSNDDVGMNRTDKSKGLDSSETEVPDSTY